MAGDVLSINGQALGRIRLRIGIVRCFLRVFELSGSFAGSMIERPI